MEEFNWKTHHEFRSKVNPIMNDFYKEMEDKGYESRIVADNKRVSVLRHIKPDTEEIKATVIFDRELDRTILIWNNRCCCIDYKNRTVLES